MNTFCTTIRRELGSFVALPQAYAMIGAYFLISGILFLNQLISTNDPDLARYYNNTATTLVVLAPIVAMRSFAEERRSGALELTLSWPVSRVGLVLGKFAANTIFVWVPISIAWLYARLLSNISEVDLGRITAGYMGLLILSATFNAVALMISARSTSPAGAAFLGFGTLLTLWVLIDFAPGWLGDSLESIGFSRHFDPFSRGVIYLEDALYFVIVSCVALALAVAALNSSRGGVKARSLLGRSSAIAAALLVWFGGTAVAGEFDHVQADLTATKRYTVTDATRRVVSEVTGPVKIVGFVEPISLDASRLRNLVKQYKSVGLDVALEIVDPDVHPGRAKEAGILGYGQYLIKMRGKEQLLDEIDQVELTSTLYRMAQGETKACFTVGHGESEIDDKSPNGLSEYADRLRQIGYAPRPLALGALGAQQALQECKVLVVAGPRVAFLPQEMDLLSEFLDSDGRLLLMSGSEAGARGQLNSLLQTWGVTIGDEVVRDASSVAGDETAVVAGDYASASPPVKNLSRHSIPVVLVSPHAIEARAVAGDADWLSRLVRSSPRSWTGSAEGIKKGPFLLAAVIDKSEVRQTADDEPVVARTRIGVVGTADAASNRLINTFGNAEFVTGLTQWVRFENDIVAAARAPGGLFKVFLTENQKTDMIRRGIVLPIAASLVPVPIALLRLKRG